MDMRIKMSDTNSVKVKITKELSHTLWCEYTLHVINDGDETVCSIEIAMDGKISRANDISRDIKSAENFLYLLAKEEVEPCHLLDIVYDAVPIEY